MPGQGHHHGIGRFDSVGPGTVPRHLLDFSHCCVVIRHGKRQAQDGNGLHHTAAGLFVVIIAAGSNTERCRQRGFFIKRDAAHLIVPEFILKS